MTVTIIDDVLIEPSETLDIALAFPVAVPGVNMLDANGLGTITDNDANGPTEGVAVADFTVNEDVGTVDFVISYTGNTVQNPFDVDFTITDGTAISPEDYTVATAIGTVTFPANTNSGDTQTVTVTIIDDVLIEPSETLDIALAFPVAVPGVNMLDANGLGTITDNDANGPTEGVAVADFTVNEDVGTVDFVISYTGNTVQNPFDVDFTITDGTAISPEDYTVATAIGTVTFPANTNSGDTQTVTVTIIDDVLIEPSETLDIALAFPVAVPGVNMLDANGLGTITDNDANGPTEGVAVADFTVNEDVGTVDFVISYTGNTVQNPFDVDFTITDGTAISPEDYTVATAIGTVTFPANTNSGDTQTVTVTIIDDVLIEPSETLDIALAFPVAVPGVNMLDANGLGTILDNDSDSDFPGDMTVECDSIPDAPPIDLNADGCDYTIDFTEDITGQDVGCANEYTITRTWTVTDCVGNVRVHVQTITVQDTQAPTFVEELPADETVICGYIPEPVTLTAVDNCDTDIEVVFNEETIFSDDTDDYMIVRTWTATDSCGNVTEHEQTIFVMQPDLEEIEIQICVEDDPIDLLSYLPEDFDTNGTFTVTSGDVELNGSMFDPAWLEIGDYTIEYSSTEGVCKYYADFTITTNSECVPCNRDEIEVSKTVTPNGDNINDFFEIKGVEYCDYTFDVMIFNRWGDKVFEAVNYQNDWDGEAPSNAVGSNGTLPAGTYYYIINVIGSDFEPLNGYIFLGVK